MNDFSDGPTLTHPHLRDNNNSYTLTSYMMAVTRLGTVEPKRNTFGYK